MRKLQVLAGFWCCSRLMAQTADIDINLLVFERPPYLSVQNGVLMGTLGTAARTALDAAGLSYRILEVPASRALNRIQQAMEPDCAIGWFKTLERERFAYFSRPLSRSGPFLVLTRSQHPRLNRPLNVEQLLADPDLMMLAGQNYSYGQTFDMLISQFTPKRTLVTLDNAQLLQMLKAGRADYSLMAAEELDALLERDPALMNGLTALPLLNAPAGETRYLMCSRKVQPELIERINSHIADLPSP